jgi:hypothetical protein
VEDKLTTKPGSASKASGVANSVASYLFHIPPAPLKVPSPLAALNPAPQRAIILPLLLCTVSSKAWNSATDVLGAILAVGLVK